MAYSRANFNKELVPGIHKLVGLSYKDYGQEWSEIFQTETSDRAFEEEVKLAGFGLAEQKAEGSSVHYHDEAGEAHTSRYEHKTYAMAFAITEEALEDNLYASLAKRYGKAMGRSMAKTKEVNAANVLNLGFTQIGGDGQPLFGDHTTRSGAVNKNYLPIGSDLNEATLEQAVIQMSSWKDEGGLIFQAKPRKIVVGPSNMFAITRLLKSSSRPGTADNDINAIANNGTIPGGFIVNHYLTNPYAWYILTDVEDGLKHFSRVKMTTGDDGDFETGNKKFKSRERYSFGYTDALGVLASQGAQ